MCITNDVSVFSSDIFTAVLEISIIDIYIIYFYLKDRSAVILCSTGL